MFKQGKNELQLFRIDSDTDENMPCQALLTQNKKPGTPIGVPGVIAWLGILTESIIYNRNTLFKQ
jgi:hypothetical protein